MIRLLFFGFLFTLNLNVFGGITEFVVTHNDPAMRNYGSEVTFSFYEKNIIEIPKNLPREENK